MSSLHSGKLVVIFFQNCASCAKIQTVFYCVAQHWPICPSNTLPCLNYCINITLYTNFLESTHRLLTTQFLPKTRLIYKKFITCKRIKSYKISFCHSCQIATVFARLSANGYERALVTQGAVPCLLLLLQCRHSQHVELAKKIRSKAAVCVGTLGSSSFGLQAIHEQGGTVQQTISFSLFTT